jgi:hypothetical protein
MWDVDGLNLGIIKNLDNEIKKIRLSQLTSLQFILYLVAGFYKPTIPQSPPSHLQDNSIC